jgi:hypothetical protein
MRYVVSYNKKNTSYTPKIHISDCREIRKQKKTGKSPNHLYSDTEYPSLNLNSCEDVENFKNEYVKKDLTCCKTCNPSCCTE